MKMNRIIALIGVLLMLPLLCVPAFATENTGTLVLRCDTQYEGKHVVFTGDEYALTKIADVWVGAWKDFNKDINPALSIMHGNRRLPGPFTVHSIPVRGCTSPCFCFLTPAID